MGGGSKYQSPQYTAYNLINVHNPHDPPIYCHPLLPCRDAYARTHAQDADPKFFTIASSFLKNCNPEHIKLDPGRFIHLCRYYKNKLLEIQQPKHGILPLLTAIQALTINNSSTITALHVDVFQLCLLSKCYSSAVPLLEQDPTSIGIHTTATDVLLYLYYGGLLETGLKRYDRALYLFTAAVTMPTEVRNAITVAALKKYILLSLMVEGSVKPLPKATSMPVVRMLKSDVAMYTELADLIIKQGKDGPDGDAVGHDRAPLNVFSWQPGGALQTPQQGAQQYRASNDNVEEVPLFQSIDQYINSKGEQLLRDGNYGLVSLLLQNMPTQKISSLKETYITLSLDKIAQQASLPSAQEAEMAVLKMIEDGALRAHIDEQHGMVRFLGEREGGHSSAETVQKIDGIIQKCMELSKEMADREFELMKGKAYITKTDKRQGSAGGVSGGGSGMHQSQQQKQHRLIMQGQQPGGGGGERPRFASSVAGDMTASPLIGDFDIAESDGDDE